MKKNTKVGMWSVAACFLLGTMWIVAGTAQARSGYRKAFIAKYDKVKDAKTAGCAICHPSKDKKERNDYGQTLGKILAAKNEKDSAKVETALKKTETSKSSVEGKTFGDLLKEGKLPGTKKKKE